jgi:outer membrane protein assembly factor BamB
VRRRPQPDGQPGQARILRPVTHLLQAHGIPARGEFRLIPDLPTNDISLLCLGPEHLATVTATVGGIWKKVALTNLPAADALARTRYAVDFYRRDDSPASPDSRCAVAYAMKASSRPGLFLLALVSLALPLRAATDPPPPQLWAVSDTSLYVDCCPAIASNGVIYVTTSGSTRYRDVSGGKLVAIDPRGREKWIFKTTVDIKSSPAIGDDGTVYFGCRDRKLYAITPDGSALWSFPTGAWVDSSPAIGTNGTIYFGSWDGKFYALNPDGSKKWEFATGGPVDSSPAIGANGVIYFGSHDSNFYALNPDGSRRWTFPTHGSIVSSPAIADDGAIIFTSVDGRLYAANPDGSEKWHFWTGGVSGSSPVLDSAGNIFVAVNNMFVAYQPGGPKKWDFGYPLVAGAAAVLEDGSVCCGAIGSVGSLYAWSADGSLKFVADLKGIVTASPAVAPDGTIYIGSSLHTCIALQGSAPLAHGGWPKFRGNPLQNGRAAPHSGPP